MLFAILLPNCFLTGSPHVSITLSFLPIYLYRLHLACFQLSEMINTCNKKSIIKNDSSITYLWVELEFFTFLMALERNSLYSIRKNTRDRSSCPLKKSSQASSSQQLFFSLFQLLKNQEFLSIILYNSWQCTPNNHRKKPSVTDHGDTILPFLSCISPHFLFCHITYFLLLDMVILLSVFHSMLTL